jgi:hypothetical protein
MRQGRGDISSLDKLRHPARRLLRQYKHRGAPVILRTVLWTPKQCADSINRGPHKSAHVVGRGAYRQQGRSRRCLIEPLVSLMLLVVLPTLIFSKHRKRLQAKKRTRISIISTRHIGQTSRPQGIKHRTKL